MRRQGSKAGLLATTVVLLAIAARSTSAQSPAATSHDVNVIIARATALRQLNQKAQALAAVRLAVSLAPGRADVLKLRDLLEHEVHGWQAEVGFEHREWNDQADPAREARVALRRNTTLGPAILRASRATRFGQHDERLELEAYPAFRGGYGALGASYGARSTLYPRSSMSAELFVTLPAQLEASAGYRRLNFPVGVNVFTGSIGKYYRDFLFVPRVNHVRGGAAGTSVSLTARRYFADDGQYFGTQVSAGSIRESIQTADDLRAVSTRSIAGEALLMISSRWVLQGRADVGRDAGSGGQSAVFKSASIALGVRF